MKLAIHHLALALLVSPLAAEAQVPGKARPQQQPQTVHKQPIRPTRFVSPIVGSVYLGYPAPDFELDGSDGRPVRLNALRGQWILLAFADRFEHLTALDDVVGELGELGIRLVGVCHEKAHALRRYHERTPLDFLVLADPTIEISAVYGLFDPQRTETIPGLVLLDPRGLVMLAVAGQRLPASDVLALARVGTSAESP